MRVSSKSTVADAIRPQVPAAKGGPLSFIEMLASTAQRSATREAQTGVASNTVTSMQRRSENPSQSYNENGTKSESAGARNHGTPAQSRAEELPLQAQKKSGSVASKSDAEQSRSEEQLKRDASAATCDGITGVAQQTAPDISPSTEEANWLPASKSSSQPFTASVDQSVETGPSTERQTPAFGVNLNGAAEGTSEIGNALIASAADASVAAMKIPADTAGALSEGKAQSSPDSVKNSATADTAAVTSSTLADSIAKQAAPNHGVNQSRNSFPQVPFPGMDTSILPAGAKGSVSQNTSKHSSSSVSDAGNLGTQDRSSSSGQSASQSAQASSGSAVPANAHSDANSLMQPIPVVQQQVTRGDTTAHTPAALHDGAVHTATLQESSLTGNLSGSETDGLSGISSARLIQTMGESEMRLGMHSSEFGAISIRTTVSQQQMQTQIAVDHGELGTALLKHIPTMESKLGNDFGMNAVIEVNHSGAGFTGDGQHASQQQTGQQYPRTAPAFAATETTLSLAVESGLTHLPVVKGHDSRLDIRA